MKIKASQAFLCFLICFSSCTGDSPQEKGQPPKHSNEVITAQSRPVSAQRLPIVLPQPEKAADQVAFPAGNPSGNYAARIISAEGGTFGYEIVNDGRPLIRQANIPGMPGNSGFKTDADARKVAETVISKLKKGEMPPTVSEEELKHLNIVK